MDTICTLCEINGYSYTFLKDKKSFNSAQKSCKKNGGSLASNIEESTYRFFNECCRDAYRFWIGLSDTNQCTDSIERYNWNDETNHCTSESPLNVLNQPNESGCQAIAIDLEPSRSGEGTIPNATELDCSVANRFICQYEKPSTASPTFSTAPTTFLTSSGGTNTTITNATCTTFPSTTNPKPAGLGFAIIAVGVLLLLVIVLLCAICLARRRHLKYRPSTQIIKTNLCAIETISAPRENK